MGYLGVRVSFAVCLITCSLSFSENNPRETPVVLAIRAARPSVVLIKTTTASSSGFFLKQVSRGVGSGVVVNSRGYILTAAHVVQGVDTISVTLPSDPQKYKAKLLAKDEQADLAILKIDAAKVLPSVRLGVSGDLEVGESLIALGHPMGMSLTATQGILGAKLEELDLGEGQLLKNILQTDAAVNPGNSGGIVVNLSGEVVGVVLAMHATAKGMGFAFPIDEAKVRLSQMIRGASPRRAKLGLVARAHGDRGVLVDSLDGDVGAGAIHYGDKIVRVNGQSIQNEADFEFALLESPEGEAVKLELDRGMETEVVSVFEKSE